MLSFALTVGAPSLPLSRIPRVQMSALRSWALSRSVGVSCRFAPGLLRPTSVTPFAGLRAFSAAVAGPILSPGALRPCLRLPLLRSAQGLPVRPLTTRTASRSAASGAAIATARPVQPTPRLRGAVLTVLDALRRGAPSAEQRAGGLVVRAHVLNGGLSGALLLLTSKVHTVAFVLISAAILLAWRG
jgi:hypothetical protein